MHKFSHPGVFTVSVECTTSDWRVTAERTITVQEPVRELGVIRCYSRNMSTDGNRCSVLRDGPAHVQVQVKQGEFVKYLHQKTIEKLRNDVVLSPPPPNQTGTNISYAILLDDQLLANSSADRGATPHNMTLSVNVMEKLGLGCRNLTVTASNEITGHSVSSGLELCVLEPVEGLQASILTDGEGCPDSTDLVISVSLEKGAPVELLFSLTGAADALSEPRDMFDSSSKIYTFSSPLEGKPVTKGRFYKRDNRLMSYIPVLQPLTCRNSQIIYICCQRIKFFHDGPTRQVFNALDLSVFTVFEYLDLTSISILLCF